MRPLVFIGVGSTSIAHGRRTYVEEKIRRAHQHLEELEPLVRSRHVTADSILRELESDGRTEVYRIPPAGEPDPRLSAVVGDLVYNAWSALNHMAVALHMSFSGIPSEDEIERIEYPLSVEVGRFKALAKKRVWGIHPGARAIIEKAQPENEGNYPFWWLYHLARIDRHRYLHIPYTAVGSIGWWGEPDGEWIDIRYGPFEDGAVVGKYRWNTDPDADMRFSFVLEPAFAVGKRV